MSPDDSLSALGFTETEALGYCELLRGGSATGYRLAQGVGKAQANTYKAPSTLVQKGAVVVDEGEPKSYRAVAPAELLSGFVLKRWPGEQLTLAVDSREYLVALLDGNVVRHAIWSDSLLGWRPQARRLRGGSYPQTGATEFSNRRVQPERQNSSGQRRRGRKRA